MTGVFVVCAAVGGTILFCQVVLTLIGLGGEAFDADVSGDVHGFGGDFHGDVGADFHGDVGADFHGDVATDFHGDTGADFHGDAVADVHADTAGVDHADHAAGHPSTVRIFGVLSFRSVVAALTFFGLAGLAAQSAGASNITVLAVAIAAGAAAMYGVYWLMRGLYQLKAEGTARIHRAIGRHATVYLKIPGRESGTGKIQVNLQNRTVEYLAMTPGDVLPTGAKVEVVDVITPDTVMVQPVLEPERIEDA